MLLYFTHYDTQCLYFQWRSDVNNFDESKVESASIRHLYNGNPVAKIILDYFAKRQRITKATSVAGIITDLPRYGCQQKFSLDKIVEVLEKLAAYGCGRLIEDNIDARNTRLVWNETISMADIGKVASEKDPTRGVPKSQNGHNREIPAGSKVVPHTYRLRPDYPPIRIELPEDFTRTEAKRLADFIMTLPYES